MKAHMNWKTGLTLLALANASSFSSVGCQKAAGLDKDRVSFNTYYSYGREFSPTDIIYGLGARLGHEIFYNDSHYHETARTVLKGDTDDQLESR